VLGIVNEPKPTAKPKPPEFSLTPTFDQICQPLQIKDIDAFVDGDKKSGIDETGGEIKDVLPGSTVKLKIELKNIGLEEFDNEIEDILITGTLEDIKDGKDIDDSSKEFELDAGDDKKVNLEFKIPEYAEEDTYDLLLEVEGEDKNNFQYSSEVELELSVEREKHKLQIENFETRDVCLGSTTTIVINIRNIGSSDKDGVLEITNDKLLLSAKRVFELEGDYSLYTEEIPFFVPKKVKAGKYPLSLNIDYGGDTLGDITHLNVLNCDKKNTTVTKISDKKEEQLPTPSFQGFAASPPEKIESEPSLIFPVIIGIILVSSVIFFILLILVISKR